MMWSDIIGRNCVRKKKVSITDLRVSRRRINGESQVFKLSNNCWDIVLTFLELREINNLSFLCTQFRHLLQSACTWTSKLDHLYDYIVNLSLPAVQLYLSPSNFNYSPYCCDNSLQTVELINKEKYDSYYELYQYELKRSQSLSKLQVRYSSIFSSKLHRVILNDRHMRFNQTESKYTYYSPYLRINLSDTRLTQINLFHLSDDSISINKLLTNLISCIDGEYSFIDTLIPLSVTDITLDNTSEINSIDIGLTHVLIRQLQHGLGSPFTVEVAAGCDALMPLTSKNTNKFNFTGQVPARVKVSKKNSCCYMPSVKIINLIEITLNLALELVHCCGRVDINIQLVECFIINPSYIRCFIAPEFFEFDHFGVLLIDPIRCLYIRDAIDCYYT